MALNLSFYLIYTPRSVRALSFYIYSLLKYSSFKFVLVSNACHEEEDEILKNITKKYPNRLSFFKLPTKVIMTHGKVLDLLLNCSNDEYFCFMDTDIFASSHISDFEKLLVEDEIAALFSSMPLWVKKEEEIFQSDFDEVVGTFNQTSTGIILGCTYFAVYRKKELSFIAEKYKLSFEEQHWYSLNAETQALLKSLGWEKKLFDTGKIINILFNKHKIPIKNVFLPELCHIGGSSFEFAINPKKTLSQRLKFLLQKTPLNYFLVRIERKKMYNIFLERYTSSKELEINFNQRYLHRNKVRKHFVKVYQALLANRALPPIPAIENEEIYGKLKKAEEDYVLLFNEFYHL